MKNTMFNHDRVENGKEEWLTPPEILSSFGPFDLDPCAPINPPWSTAKESWTEADDGLSKPWRGFVFCNPPYGKKTPLWLKKCADYGNALVLVFARPDTRAFQEQVLRRATALFFISGRLTFYHVSGEKAANPAGAPSVLVAYGAEANGRLVRTIWPGVYLKL